jgi:enamine deaminase RidA (YjgF/YER057c/UK114 family)
MRRSPWTAPLSRYGFPGLKTLDLWPLISRAALLQRRLVLDKTDVRVLSDDGMAPVAVLRVLECHTEEKPASPPPPALPLPPSGAPMIPPELVPDRPQVRLGRPMMVASGLRRGAQVCVSGVRGRGQSAAEQMTACLEAVSAYLGRERLGMDDVAFVHLYLSSMATFGTVNGAYCRAFGEHPPSRSCIEVPLGDGCLVMMDALVLGGSGASMRRGRFKDRKVRQPGRRGLAYVRQN